VQGDKEISVKLKFGADAQSASQAVQDLQRQTSQLSKSEQEYQRMLKDRAKQIELQKRLNLDLHEMGVKGGNKSEREYQMLLKERVKQIELEKRLKDDLRKMGLNDGDKSRWQEIAMGASKAAASVMLVSRAFESAGKAAKVYYKTGSTVGAVAQGLDTLLLGLPGHLADSYESVAYGRSQASLERQLEREGESGQRANIERSAYQQRFAIQREGVAVASESWQAERAVEWERTQLAAARQARAEGREPTDPRIVDAMRAEQGALADQFSARKQVNVLAGEEDRLRKLIGGLYDVRDKIATGNKGNNRFNEEEKKSKLREQDNKILTEQAKLQDVLNQKKAAAADLDQKSFIAKQRTVDITRAELAITTEKYQKAKANEESFAAMSAGDKLGALYALQDVQKRGIAAQPQEVRDLLLNNPLTSEYTRKLIGKEADTDPVLAQVARLMGAERASDLEKKKIELEEKIAVEVVVNKAEFAKTVRDAFEANKEDILKIISDVASAQYRLLNNPQRQAEK